MGQVQTEVQWSITSSLKVPIDGSSTSFKEYCNLFHVLGANAEKAVLPKSDLLKGVSKVIKSADLVEWGFDLRISIELIYGGNLPVRALKINIYRCNFLLFSGDSQLTLSYRRQ